MSENTYEINSLQWWEQYFKEEWHAHGGSDQTRYFMQCLLDELPTTETNFLKSKGVSILDWGCAFGEGVDLLATVFPQGRVIGLDFASRAIEHARQNFSNREFTLAPNGEISDDFDVVIASNCLEHFEYPLDLVKAHLSSCRQLYIALVPYNEFPLSEYHRSQFKEESFPNHLGGFARIYTKIIETNPLYWNGRQLLVAYGSRSYVRERIALEHRGHEQEKWDHYYASLPLLGLDEATQAFGNELTEHISELLPTGSRILEAGCGGGWQSVALARSGFRVSLLDFSSEALNYSRRLFEREKLQAEFIHADAFEYGEPEFDLVFNAGVLEHYSLEEQCAFLRAMGSRSRNYLLALVPNRLCYWYWPWRIQKAARGEWPFGKEIPLADFSDIFQAAGLTFVGQTFMGREWAESFLAELFGTTQDLRDQILEVNRSPVFPKEQTAYLLAGLGSVLPNAHAPSQIWRCSPRFSDDTRISEMQAVLADALALRISAEQKITQSLAQNQQMKEELRALESRVREAEQNARFLSTQLSSKDYQLGQIVNSRSWRLVMRYAGLKHRLLIPPYRSLKALLAKTSAKLERQSNLRGQRALGLSLSEPRSKKSQFVASSHRSSDRSPKADVLSLSIIDWDFRFQRPQQLMLRFAAAGHRVFYVSQKFQSGAAYTVKEKRKNIFEISLRGPDLNVYTDILDEKACDALFNSLDILRRESSMGATVLFVQLPFWRPLADKARAEFAWPTVYDCMDHHQGFSTNGQTMVNQERQLLESADLVIVSSESLERRARQHNPNVFMVRNACDYDHFATVRNSQNGKPVIGYYGAIADWFDSDLVADLAEKRQDWQFALVGSTFSADLNRLSNLPNIVLTGEKPYSEIPDWLSKFRVAILPFKRLPLTEATNPVKAYEILAAGKPLVSVPISEMVALSPLVRLASTVEEFEKEIASALDENDQALTEKRRAFAKSNTWEKRYEVLVPAVFKTFPRASIIVVTFNNVELNRLCLESIYACTEWPNFEVIVVDNGSADDTPEYLKEAESLFPNLRVVLNQANLGFAAANNIGLKLATGDYLFLLNNDTVVTRGWASALIRHLHTNPEIGMIGPVTNAIANEAKVEVNYARLEEMHAWAADYTQHHDGQTFPIPMLAMFCAAMRREVFEKVGLLDERFGIGMFEDDDYCQRLQAYGFELRCARDSFVHHWQRASLALLGEEEYLRLYRENKNKYEIKWNRREPVHKANRNTYWRELENVLAKIKNTKGAVIFPPSIGWNVDLFQRPHHLAREFVRQSYVVVFDSRNSNDNVKGLEEVESDLFLFNGPEELLHEIPDPILWTFPYNFDQKDTYRNTRTIYDWIDDLAVFNYDRGLLERNHRRALNEAEVVSCVARRLHSQALAVRNDAVYLPNGVEYERFAIEAQVPKDVAALISQGKPIAGYYGALAEWFDYQLLDEVADRRPDWNFLLIGPAYDYSITRQRLLKRTNVRWVGPRQYASLPGYLSAFDVAIIPFVINNITLATSPLKLYEYFAGGKAVITTPIPECASFSDVRIVLGSEDFSRALDTAREQGQNQEYRARARAIARDNSWASRVEVVEKLLTKEKAEGKASRVAALC